MRTTATSPASPVSHRAHVPGSGMAATVRSSPGKVLMPQPVTGRPWSSSTAWMPPQFKVWAKSDSERCWRKSP